MLSAAKVTFTSSLQALAFYTTTTFQKRQVNHLLAAAVQLAGTLV